MKRVRFIQIICFVYMSVHINYGMLNGRPIGQGESQFQDGVRLPGEQFCEFQRVNHFDGSDFRYWKQRFFVNNATFRTGGPIFLMLGGKVEASAAWLVDGAWQQYARDHGAFLVLLEHRYYGKSHPVPDISTPNLQYLSSRQAMADIAQFIAYFKSHNQYLQNASIILFGGSYAGSLAAWARSRYPYLVDGVVASSAPMVALMEFKDYYADVGEALGSECRQEVRNATSRMFDWWGQPQKRILMQKLFRLCDKINHDVLFDLYTFFYTLAENFARVVQFNNDNMQFLGEKGSNLTIQRICNIMTDYTRGDSIQRYADVSSLILDTYGQKCLDFKYSKRVKSLNQTNWDSVSLDGSRQWLYQKCSEFGWIQSSFSIKQPFGQSLFEWNLTTEQCISVFPPKIFGGMEVIDNCEETNRFYGGINLPISNAIFVNGMMDPWRKVGLNATTSNGVEIIFIDDAAHCADMYPPSPRDSPPLTAARAMISKQIGKWLAH